MLTTLTQKLWLKIINIVLIVYNLYLFICDVYWIVLIWLYFHKFMYCEHTIGVIGQYLFVFVSFFTKRKHKLNERRKAG